MKRKPVIIGVAIIVIAAIVVAVVLLLGGGDEAGAVAVRINAQGADDVGAVHIELIYDADVLQATGVEKGTLASNAMLQSNLEPPGWVVVSMIDSSGMNGEGSLAVVTFEVVGESGMSTPLLLGNLEAWDATDVFGIPTESEPASFTVSGRKVVAPVLIFNP